MYPMYHFFGEYNFTIYLFLTTALNSATEKESAQRIETVPPIKVHLHTPTRTPSSTRTPGTQVTTAGQISCHWTLHIDQWAELPYLEHCPRHGRGRGEACYSSQLSLAKTVRSFRLEFPQAVGFDCIWAMNTIHDFIWDSINLIL